jgi:hypothetical protein
MPIIGQYYEPDWLFYANRNRSATIGEPEVAVVGSIVARRRRNAADGSGASIDAARRVAGGVIAARRRMNPAYSSIVGRVNDDPNQFGMILADRNRSTVVNSARRVSGTIGAARLRNDPEAQVGISAAVAGAASDELALMLSIAAEGSRGGLANPGSVARYAARISADGENYAIKSFRFEEPPNALGMSLSFTLVNPKDRTAILAADQYKFEFFGGNSSTAPTWETIFDSGKRSGSNYSFAWRDGRSADTLSVSTIAPMSARLEAAPPTGLTIFDPDRISLDASDFKPMLSQDGSPIPHQLEESPGLTLHKLFEAVFVGRCGFGAIQTTIDDYKIRRADFSPTSSYLDGVAPHIGAFKPFFKVIGETLWILDGTTRFPAGFSNPGELKADAYISAQFNEEELNLDGFIVQYAEDEVGGDYFTTRVVPGGIQEFGDGPFAANYMTVQNFVTWRDYYRDEDPSTPIRTEKVQDKTVTRASVNGSILQDVLTETETFVFDSNGLILRTEKTLFGLAPSLGGGSFAQTIRSTKTWFKYIPDRFSPKRKILHEKREEVTGLVAIDTENQQLGQDFVQDFTEAFSAGNLKDGMTLVTRPIRTTIETTTQTGKGQSEIKTRVTDFLTQPPQLSGSTTDARGGDGSTNDVTAAAIERQVLRPGVTERTAAKLAYLSVMEIPWAIAEPLALRRLEQTKTQRGPVLLKGVKTALTAGRQFDLFHRDGTNAGTFVIEGRTIEGDNLGTAAQRTRNTIILNRV